MAEKLFEELPGIFNWAIEGWKRLQERGQFVQPAAGVEAVDQMQEMASPVSTFVGEQCLVGFDT